MFAFDIVSLLLFYKQLNGNEHLSNEIFRVNICPFERNERSKTYKPYDIFLKSPETFRKVQEKL